jgi:protocatechuate 3,4-dioxygenase beta subunit
MPVAGAKVDVWQADDSGAYDNAGYRLRGYTLTDDSGRYAMETIVPGSTRAGHGISTSRCRCRAARC